MNEQRTLVSSPALIGKLPCSPVAKIPLQSIGALEALDGNELFMKISQG